MATPGDLRRAIASVGVVGGALSLVMLVMGGLGAAWSTVVGVLVVVLNMLALDRVWRTRTTSPPRTAVQRLLAAVGASLRVLVLYAGVWFVLKKRIADPIPFVVGLMALPVGLLLYSSMRWFGRAKEGADHPPPSPPDPDA
jgi:hypothetical protein